MPSTCHRLYTADNDGRLIFYTLLSRQECKDDHPKTRAIILDVSEPLDDCLGWREKKSQSIMLTIQGASLLFERRFSRRVLEKLLETRLEKLIETRLEPLLETRIGKFLGTRYLVSSV